jgi:lactate racemase
VFGGIRVEGTSRRQRRLIELGPDKFRATLTAKSMADVDEWQTAMQLKSMRVGRISLCTSGLSDEERALTGAEMIADLDEAIVRSIARAEDRCVAVIPEGPYVVPYYDAG